MSHLKNNRQSTYQHVFCYVLLFTFLNTFLPLLNKFDRTDVSWRNLICYLLPWLCWKFGTHIFNLAVLLSHLQRYWLASSYRHFGEATQFYWYYYFLFNFFFLINVCCLIYDVLLLTSTFICLIDFFGIILLTVYAAIDHLCYA